MIIVFNNPRFEALPFVDLIYRPFFPSILYCSLRQPKPDPKKFPFLFDPSTGSLKYSFTFYTKDWLGGPHFHDCVSQAFRMRYDVDGYFVVGDDVLVLPRMMHNFDANFSWISATYITDLITMKDCHSGICNADIAWVNWRDQRGLRDINLNVLNYRYMEKNSASSPLVGRCFEQLVNFTGGKGRSLKANVDAFYIPQRFALQYAKMSDIMLRHNLFMENAVPIIIWCLEDRSRIQLLSPYLDWSPTRWKPWEVFKTGVKRYTYMHPMKWSLTFDHTVGADTTKMFCQDVIPQLHSPNT